MGHHKVIMFFGVLSFLGWLGGAGTTQNIAKEIGFHKKYYPSKYILPNRKLRKILGMKKREIPKWLYRELLLSFVYIGLFIIFTLVYLLSENKLFITQMFWRIYVTVFSGHILHMMIFLYMYLWKK